MSSPAFGPRCCDNGKLSMSALAAGIIEEKGSLLKDLCIVYRPSQLIRLESDFENRQTDDLRAQEGVLGCVVVRRWHDVLGRWWYN